MKKLLSLSLASMMAVMMLAGCGSQTAQEKPAATEAAGTEAAGTEAAGTESTAVKTIKDGVLMVGTEIGYPPMEYFDEDGATPIGFDMELAAALAEEMGLELELVDTAWDGIFAGVETDKYDVIISSVSWNEDRNAAHSLTDNYVANAPVIVVPVGSDITDIADCDGKAVAVQMETTADYLMQDKVAEGLNVDLRQYEKVINCFDDLKAGRVEAVCTDSVVAAYYLGEDIDGYQTVWQSDVTEPICMCVKKGNDDLTAALNEALAAVKESGKLAEISVKYFGTEDCINNVN